MWNSILVREKHLLSPFIDTDKRAKYMQMSQLATLITN
jgi:hypothetical protein